MLSENNLNVGRRVHRDLHRAVFYNACLGLRRTNVDKQRREGGVTYFQMLRLRTPFR